MNELALLRLRIAPLPLLLRADSQRLEILDELSMGLELLCGCAIKLLDLEEYRRPLLCLFCNQILRELDKMIMLIFNSALGTVVHFGIRATRLYAKV